jgi:lipoprotein-anchoring transpeptidase ErfK/SrfK
MSKRSSYGYGKQQFLMMLAASVIILAVFVVSNLGRGAKDKVVLAEGYNADLSGEVDKNEKLAYIGEESVELPEYVFSDDVATQVLGVASGERWIEIDLSDQKLYAWEGNKLYLETLVSTGLPGTPTPQGEFRIWIKLRATKMEGGSGRYYYYLPNVPYTMFFENSQVPAWRGYGLHGTYWHNDFGRTHSHGCVNLPTPIAKQLYEWTNPVLPGGKGIVYASASDPGTRIVIHQ